MYKYALQQSKGTFVRYNWPRHIRQTWDLLMNHAFNQFCGIMVGVSDY